jgi:hypothetical protein
MRRVMGAVSDHNSVQVAKWHPFEPRKDEYQLEMRLRTRPKGLYAKGSPGIYSIIAPYLTAVILQ